MPRTVATALVSLAALAAAPTVAAAHVTLQPAQAASGAYTVLAVRVPNEEDGASTVKVQVQLPDGFLSASTQDVPGWTSRVVQRKLAKPVEVDGIDVDSQVGQLVFTATGKGVRPGHFQDFPVSLKLPDGKPGSALTFKALQTYSDGDVVRWIGSPDSEHPAPQVTLTAGDGVGTAHGAGADPAAAPGPATAAATTSGGTDGLAVVALIVGALGLLTGAAGLALARRSSAR